MQFKFNFRLKLGLEIINNYRFILKIQTQSQVKMLIF
jgi:hypothetical protein